MIHQPIYEVKCYDLVVIDFTTKHAEADESFTRSRAEYKTLTKLMPDGRRFVIKQHPEPRTSDCIS